MYIERPVIKLAAKRLDECSSLDIDNKNPHQKAGDSVLRIGNQSLEDYLLMTNIMQPILIKEFLSKQDWSLFEKNYSKKGRRPYKPEVMVGLILYGLTNGVSSLRDLTRMARLDLGCIFITEGAFPDNSSICRFIQRHTELLSEEFFINLTRLVLKTTRSGVSSVAGDGTIIEAASSRYRLMKQEAIVEQRNKLLLKAEAAPDDAKLAADTAKIEQVTNILQDRINGRKKNGKSIDSLTIHPLEPEAVIQPTKKGKASVPAYKPSVLANDKRVIVGIDVNPSNEIQSLFPMVDMANKIGENESVKELLLDAGYCSVNVLSETVDREISILCSPESNSKKKDSDNIDKSKYSKKDFVYDEASDNYTCPQGQQLTRLGQSKTTNLAGATYSIYGTSACNVCPLKEKCTSNKKGRRINRYDGDELKEALKKCMEQPLARNRLRQRKAIVEPVFSHLRLRQNFNRFHRKGLLRVRVEFSLQAMAYNISRVIALHL